MSGNGNMWRQLKIGALIGICIIAVGYFFGWWDNRSAAEIAAEHADQKNRNFTAHQFITSYNEAIYDLYGMFCVSHMNGGPTEEFRRHQEVAAIRDVTYQRDAVTEALDKAIILEAAAKKFRRFASETLAGQCLPDNAYLPEVFPEL